MNDQIQKESTEHALDILGFGRICDEIEKRCQTPKAKNRAQSLTLLDNIDSVRYSMSFIQDMREMIEGNPYPLDGLSDINDEIALARKDGILDPESLWKVMRVVALTERLLRFSKHGGRELLTLAPFLNGLMPTPEISEQIQRFLDPPGELKENASPILVQIGRDIIKVHDRIQSRLEKMLASQKYQGIFQDDIITIRNDRFVLPVRVEAGGRFEGVVHDRSGSGQTLFMEPLSVIPDNNELKNLKIEKKREMARILTSLSRLVKDKGDILRANLNLLFTLDYYFAAAKVASLLECNVPELDTEDFVLQEAYNPILLMEIERKKTVPLNFRMNGEIRGFLVTGPNMGGKTVALKTAGLIAAMALSGLPIPAEKGTKIPVFKSIFADIGDEQSIEFSLSSFAAHVRRWSEIADGADSNSLILLDELGASTDPVEGVPLVTSLIEFALQKKSRLFVTTHLSELLPFAEEREDIENCSMAFDQDELKSTFRFRQGIPERSFAIPVAERLGLKKSIIDRSRELASGESLKLDTLLANISDTLKSVEDKEEKLTQKLDETKVEYKNYSDLVDKQKRLTRELSEKKVELEREHQARIETELMKMREELNEAIEDILSQEPDFPQIDSKPSGKIEKRNIMREDKRVKKLKEMRKEAGSRARDIRKKLVMKKGRPIDIDKNERVYIKRLQKEGITTTSTDENGYIKVAVGAMKLRLHSSSLELLDSKPENREPERQYIAYKEPEVETKMDVRGYVFSQAWDKLDRWIGDAHRAGHERLLVIHGKGTGVLGRKIHAQLSTDKKRVKSFKYAEVAEGGMGATVIKLKQ